MAVTIAKCFYPVLLFLSKWSLQFVLEFCLLFILHICFPSAYYSEWSCIILSRNLVGWYICRSQMVLNDILVSLLQSVLQSLLEVMEVHYYLVKNSLRGALKSTLVFRLARTATRGRILTSSV